MFFRQVYEEGLAQASYVIGCQASGSTIVIDPKRDIDTYLELARQEGLRIVAVAETHIHADYLSGARELAHATGARLYLSGEGDEDWKYAGLESFDHRLLKDGDTIELGNLTLTALHTPGHTPEHLSFLLTDRATTDQPGFLLSGDFVFVGDLGRPDLLEEAAGIVGSALPAARRMFQSLKEKFLTLPDYVQVWPGHGAGSACGKALGAVPSSTVGYERRFAWWADYLHSGDEEGFVKALLEGQPEAPAYFARMKRLNREGMSLLGGLPEPPRLSPERFRALLQAGAVLVDTRDKLAFAEGHLRGSINIPSSRGFSTWAGWLLPHDRPLVLLAPLQQVEELTRKLVRIGLDDIQGYIPGLEGYAGGELETVPQLSAEQARELLEKGEAIPLDVRAADEYAQSHIPGALNLHAGRVMQHLERLPRDRPLITYCLGGDRSSTATSALLAAGFTNVANLAGGLKDWKQQGYPLERGPTPS